MAYHNPTKINEITENGNFILRSDMAHQTLELSHLRRHLFLCAKQNPNIIKKFWIVLIKI